MANRKKSALALILVALPALGGANASVLKTESFKEFRFASEVEAIQAAADAFLSRSRAKDAEFVGGILLSTGGRYRLTVGEGQKGQDSITYAVGRRADEMLLALWHTHGTSGPGRNFFSPQDVRLVQEHGLPLYLITPAGQIRVLVPEAAAVRARRAPVGLRSAARAPRGALRGQLVQGPWRIRPEG